MSWPLPRQIAAFLVAGHGALLIELRALHAAAIHETWHAVIPLAYCGAMLAFGAIAIARWERGGRRALTLLFALGLLVGSLGLWFHADGLPVASVRRVLAAWLPSSAARAPKGPPPLAPGAFVSLGALGLIACRRGWSNEIN